MMLPPHFLGWHRNKRRIVMSIRVPFDTVNDCKASTSECWLERKGRGVCHLSAQSSADGVESHALTACRAFVEYVQKGWVNPEANPVLVGAKGAVENYDGNLGVGITNANFLRRPCR